MISHPTEACGSGASEVRSRTCTDFFLSNQNIHTALSGETTRLPKYCLDSRHESIRIDGNHYILYSPDDASAGAQIVEPDGTLVREIRFPASAKKVWARRVRGIYAVSDTLEVTVYDPTGNLKEVIPPALSPAEPAAVLMDLYPDPEKILYKQKDNCVIERELRTGTVRRLRKCVSREEARYLHDGSVLLPLFMSAEFDEEDFAYVEDFFPRFFTAEWEELEQDYSDWHHIFGIGHIDPGSGKLKGCFPFESYLELLYETCTIRTNSENSLFLAELGFIEYKSVEVFGVNKTTVVFDAERAVGDPEEPINEWTRGMNVQEETILFPEGEILCGRTEDEIWIRDLKSDSLAPAFSCKIRASRILLRPDGRELYAEVTENGSTLWKVFRLQFACDH